jgi:hypothetical protein
MPLPRPEIGLIVHYGFVWSGPDRGPPPDAGKDRPCLIVDLLQEEIVPLYILCLRGRLALRRCPSAWEQRQISLWNNTACVI